jgi:hypothetical protein
MFQWRPYGRWLEGTWKKNYEWTQRTLTQQNSWVVEMEHWKIQQAFETAVMGVRALPLRNFLTCRISPTSETLDAVANSNFPKPTLGSAQAQVGVESAQIMGNIQITFSSTSNEGTAPVDAEFQTDPVAGALAAQTTRRLSKKSINSDFLGGRKLSGALSLQSLEASCYAVIQSDSQAVGQLIGDCVVFSPASTLTGTAELCLAINALISVNPALSSYGTATKSDTSVYTVSTTTATLDGTGQKLCVPVQAAGTYCPIKYLPAYTPGTTFTGTGVDDSCSSMVAVTQSATSQSQELQAAGYTGSGNLVKVGQATPPPSSGSLDTSGAVLGTNGVIENVDDAVATATEAPGGGTTAPPCTNIFGCAPAPTPAPTPAPAPAPTPAPTPAPPTSAPTPAPTLAPTPAPTTTPNPFSNTQAPWVEAEAEGGGNPTPVATFSGVLTIAATGVTKAQMEVAMKKTIEAKMCASTADKCTVEVVVTETRRLQEAPVRNLAGNFDVQFKVTVPETQATAVQSVVTATEASTSDMLTTLQEKLVDEGVTSVSAVSVSDFGAVNDADITDPSGGMDEEASGGASVAPRGSSLAFSMLPSFFVLEALFSRFL